MTPKEQKAFDAMRDALEDLELLWHRTRQSECLPMQIVRARAAIAAAKAVSEQPKKLQVTLEDRPVDIELAQYKRMFEVACVALGSISEALGLDPEDGGAEPILDAIAELKVVQPQARKPLRDEMVKQMKERCDAMVKRGAFADGWLSAEEAHGIKEQL